MKTEKLSLKAIKNVLSRTEMKQIMAGSAPGSQCCLCWSSGTPPTSFAYIYDPNNIDCGDFCRTQGYTGPVSSVPLIDCGH